MTTDGGETLVRFGSAVAGVDRGRREEGRHRADLLSDRRALPGRHRGRRDPRRGAGRGGRGRRLQPRHLRSQGERRRRRGRHRAHAADDGEAPPGRRQGDRRGEGGRPGAAARLHRGPEPVHLPGAVRRQGRRAAEGVRGAAQARLPARCSRRCGTTRWPAGCAPRRTGAASTSSPTPPARSRRWPGPTSGGWPRRWSSSRSTSAAERAIGVDDVEDLVAETREHAIFELTKAIGMGDVPRVAVAAPPTCCATANRR